MLNYKIDETLLPEIWLTWESANGRIWMNKGGNRQTYAEWWMHYEGEPSLYQRYTNNGRTPFGINWRTKDNNKVWVQAGSTIHFAYAKYHEDIERLEVAMVKYDTTRGDHEHEWSYAGDRLFIGKDKSVINQHGWLNPDEITVKRNTFVRDTVHALQTILRANPRKSFVAEFKKFLGCQYFIIGNGTSVNVEYSHQIVKWFKSKQKERSTNKAQNMVDELTSLPLGSLDGLEYKYPPKYDGSTWRGETLYINNVIYFERVNNEWSVLRALIRHNDEFDEAWRVYVGDNGETCFASKSNGDWISSSQHTGWDLKTLYYLANLPEAAEKCDRIKYIMPMLTSHEGVRELVTALRFPTVEQLYKLGYAKFATTIVHSGTPKAEIKKLFGGYYKENERSVLRQVGMTKAQLDGYHGLYEGDNGYYSKRAVLEIMREIFGGDLSHIDLETYAEYLYGVNSVLCGLWARSYVDSLNVDKGKFWKNTVRLQAKNSEASRLISDTISAYRRLDTCYRPEVNWLFDDYSDIVRTHDALTELVNEQEREWRRLRNMSEAERHRLENKKLQEADEKRKHYEYEDDNFIIRLPKNVGEIVTEGSEQHICIGGYTTRHSKGETNIFFLRRKDDESTPFYAIEMNNNKSVEQIHGFGNKWLGNNPEAIPTVVRWCRKHGIKCDNTILTCTALGYGKRNTYIEMPVVD